MMQIMGNTINQGKMMSNSAQQFRVTAKTIFITP